MKAKFIVLLTALVLVPLSLFAQEKKTDAEKLKSDLLKIMYEYWGPVVPVAQKAEEKLRAKLKGASVDLFMIKPNVSKAYYQVKQGGRTYVLEFNYETAVEKVLNVDVANTPASVVGHMSSDHRDVFLASSNGKDGYVKIFIYNPESGEYTHVETCKSITYHDFYVSVVLLPISKNKERNLLTYDGNRISVLGNSLETTYLDMGKGDLDDPFDDSLIGDGNVFDPDE